MKSLQEVLSEMKYDPRSYSGRGMYGKTCLAVIVDHPTQCFDLVKILGLMGVKMSHPSVDSFGKRLIIYWPDTPFQAEKKQA